MPLALEIPHAAAIVQVAVQRHAQVLMLLGALPPEEHEAILSALDVVLNAAGAHHAQLDQQRSADEAVKTAVASQVEEDPIEDLDPGEPVESS